MTAEVVKALHDSIKNFGIYVIAGETRENITKIVRFLLVVCAKLSEINDLPSKFKLYVIEGF